MEYWLVSAAVALGVPLLFSLLMFVLNYGSDWDRAAFFGIITFLLAVAVALHFWLARTGLAALWAQPLGWALCMIPNYIYSYHVFQRSFFGPSFSFTVIWAFFILPPGVLAVILCLVELIGG